MTVVGDSQDQGRRAGTRPPIGQGAILLAGSCLPILGSVLLAPVLPRMAEAFATTAGVSVLVPIVLTAPALMIGLLAPVAGRLVDAAGRKRVLLVALVLYALFGTAPLYLDSLGAIVASRVGVGICEAAIMTACTTLLADLFDGTARDRWFARQTIATTLAATVFFGLGGALGAVSWRAPFVLYVSSLVIAVLVAVFVRNTGRTPAAALPPVPWRLIAVPCAVTLFGGIVFYTPIAELSLVLASVGVTSTATIGLLSAIASLATAAGGFTFGRVARRGTAVLLPIALGLAGVGLVVMGVSPAVPVIAVGAVIASAGTGLLLPTLLTWALSGLGFAERGRGTGMWTAAMFIGQFFCPLVILAASAPLGTLSAAVLALGVLAAVGAGFAPLIVRRWAARLA
ncbi:MFS transporter [Actinomycetospora termitidis]|uniref:MFS transporter n=1 Tax=Actinomycetospora termitidis TaxID=3053470 RepID=A0ABT7M6Q2_9PSEU|nr:MFS transporter [Actinomycetospora sp. Odt1-22]MDL5156351.1 MFS transporter [Actinomycetospora sp. Odt1-22]